MVFNSQNGKVGLNAQWFGAHTVKDIQKISTATKNYNLIAEKSIVNAQKYATSVGTCDEKLGAYLKNLNGAKASVANYSASLIGARIQTVALQAASMALNMALTWGISLAIQLLVEFGKHLYNVLSPIGRLKKAIEDTNNAISEYETAAQELDTVNNRLEEISKRIAEINDGTPLSLTDKAELETLKAETRELERQKEILESDAKTGRNNAVSGADDVIKDFDDVVNKIPYMPSTEHWSNFVGNLFSFLNPIKPTGGMFNDIPLIGPWLDNVLGLTQTGEEIQKNIDEAVRTVQGALKTLWDSGYRYKNGSGEFDAQIEQYEQFLYEDLVRDGADISQLTKYLMSMSKYQDEIAQIKEQLAEGTFDVAALESLFNSNEDFKELFISLIESGALGEDFKEAIAGSDGVVSAEEAAKISTDDFKNALPLLANELNKVEKAAKNSASAVKSFKNIANEIDTAIDAITNAQTDMTENGYLTVDSIVALEEAGLTDYLKETENGYILANGALETYLDNQGKDYQDAVSKAVNNASNLATQQEAVAAGYENSAKGLLLYLKAQKALAQSKMSSKISSDLPNDEMRMFYYNQKMKQVNEQYDPAINSIETAIKNQEKFDKVIKTKKKENKDKKSNSGSETNKTAEKKIDNLKHRHEMGLISEATYYKELEKIRKKYYAGKKKYLDRDRELQEEYHDWEVKNAEDGFEKKVEALQEKYANGKITYAKLKSEIKKLINKTFKNDKDTKNKYLDELPDYLSDAKEKKEEKNREKFDSSYDKFKYQLENGFITEATYYKKLDALYKKHYGDKTKYLDEYAQYSQEVYDGFKEMYKKDYEAQKESLEKQKEEITEYYDDLIEKKREEHDAEDYEKEQSEKRKKIFDIDMQIAELMRDGSEKAKARIAELEEERKDAAKELEDFEKDHAREKEIERLEKEKEAREKAIEKEIKNIDEQLEDLNTNTKDIRDTVIKYAKAKGVDIKFAYASGTRSSVGGFGRINEKGIEMISAPDGNGNYVNLMPSSYVFSAKATEFLWKLATEHSLPQAMYNSIAKSIKTQSSTPSVNIAQPITITMGDIIIKGNADKQTVADIKKQQENTVRMVLQKIKELQK